MGKCLRLSKLQFPLPENEINDICCFPSYLIAKHLDCFFMSNGDKFLGSQQSAWAFLMGERCLSRAGPQISPLWCRKMLGFQGCMWAGGWGGRGGGEGIDCCSGSEWEEEEARKGGGASEGPTVNSQRGFCVSSCLLFIIFQTVVTVTMTICFFK